METRQLTLQLAPYPATTEQERIEFLRQGKQARRNIRGAMGGGGGGGGGGDGGGGDSKILQRGQYIARLELIDTLANRYYIHM